MSTAVPDGLDSLDALAQRAKRTPPQRPRRVLPPQNPASPAPRSTPAQVSSEVLEEHLTPPMFTTPASAPASASAPEAALAPSPVLSSAPSPAPAPAALRKVAVYLTDDLDAALDAIHYAGASRRPRLDVSKSAVVRVALERLLEQMTHEEVVAAIASRPTDPQASGRKRR